MDLKRKESPFQFLSRMEGRKTRVVLKWGNVFEGILLTFDSYMNIVLGSASEILTEKNMYLGDICIRCNNIKIIEEILI